MRVIWLAAFLAGLALPARADIVDSGTLTMGGQGIFGGTLTVQGSGFSVGGSTFAVGGGSVTLGGRLNAAAAGIRWADGSTSTTAAAGGSGNAQLSATQTFSGSQTFSSRLAIGSPALGTSTHSVIGIWAKSVSGQTDGAECVMIINSVDSSGYVTVTSTNTGVNISAGGVCVLQSACDPGSVCFCVTHGLVHITGNSATVVGQIVTPSGTRCHSANETPASASTYNGYVIQCDSSNPRKCYAMLGIH